MEGRDYEEDQQKDGETIWMSIGMKPPGREQHKIGKLGNNMLRPSPNHGTIRLIYRQNNGKVEGPTFCEQCNSVIAPT